MEGGEEGSRAEEVEVIHRQVPGQVTLGWKGEGHYQEAAMESVRIARLQVAWSLWDGKASPCYI